jgi:hypothetical protein
MMFRRYQLMFRSIMVGFSMNCFILTANLATEAPSSTLWSHEILMFIYTYIIKLVESLTASAGTNL